MNNQNQNRRFDGFNGSNRRTNAGVNNGNVKNINNQANMRRPSQSMPIPMKNGEGKGKSIVKKYLKEMTTMPEELRNKPKEKIRLHTIKEKVKKPLPIGFIVMVLIFTALFMYTINDFVRINEFTIEIADMKNQLQELEAERKELAVALDAKNDLIAIEKRAKELGMVKKDQVDKEYIENENEDKIELNVPESSENVHSLFTLMNSLKTNFRAIMEYIN